jgi:hypothetical protein
MRGYHPAGDRTTSMYGHFAAWRMQGVTKATSMRCWPRWRPASYDERKML